MGYVCPASQILQPIRKDLRQKGTQWLPPEPGGLVVNSVHPPRHWPSGSQPWPLSHQPRVACGNPGRLRCLWQRRVADGTIWCGFGGRACVPTLAVWGSGECASAVDVVLGPGPCGTYGNEGEKGTRAGRSHGLCFGRGWALGRAAGWMDGCMAGGRELPQGCLSRCVRLGGSRVSPHCCSLLPLESLASGMAAHPRSLGGWPTCREDTVQ